MAIEKTLEGGIDDIANEFGAELVKRLQRELINNGKLASGSLIGQMDYKVKSDKKGNTVVQLFSEDYFRFVDKGRRPGKQPPLRAIKEWTRIKLIPEKFAFPIAKKIGEVGIKGLNIINPTIDKLVVEFLPLYEEEMVQLLGVVLVNDIFNKTNTKGRIIPKTVR